MAILVSTDAPGVLLANIRKAIDDKKVVTWSYDASGDFTHDPEQWKHDAWLRPTVQKGQLVFGIIKNQTRALTDVIYGVYHGRFVEMLLTHHSHKFVTASPTAQFLKPYDVF